jgi:ABC-type transporter Mla subunit MlaD
MNTEARRSRRAWLGGGLLLLLVALAAGIFLLDDVIAAFRSTYRITVVIPEAPGLGEGSRVWVGGRDAGTVESIEFRPARGDSGGDVLLGVVLPEDVREQVRRDSDVRVTAENMMGEPVVDVIPGTARAASLQEHDTLIARPRPDAAALMAHAQALRADMDSLRAAAAALAPMVAQRRAGFARVERHLTAAQREYDDLMSAVEQSPGLALLSGEELAGVTERLARILDDVAAALAQQQERLRESGAQEGIARVQKRAESVSAALDELRTTMDRQHGTLSRMSTDSALVQAIARARAELDSLIAEVKRNPMRFAL